MALQDALGFLGAARRDEAIGRDLDAIGETVSWDALVEAGARAGFDFTSEELQRAHQLDWTMRWARYG